MIIKSNIFKRKGKKLWRSTKTLLLIIAMLAMNLPLSAPVSATDLYGITLSPSSGLVTTEGGGTDTFTVQLNSKPSNTVTVNLASNDTTEGTVTPSSVTFTADRTWDSQSRLPTGVPSTIGLNVNPSGTWVPYPVSSSLSQCVAQLVSWPAVDIDWITGQTAAGGYILFSFDPFSIPETATNIRLTVHFRARDNGGVTGTNNIGACLGMGGGNIMYAPDTSTSNPGTSFGLGGYTWDINPMLKSQWTAGQINGYEAYGLLQFGVYSSDLDPNIDVSCVSAQVSYDYFTPSNWNTPQTVTVKGVNDAIDDGDVSYTINASASSADSNFNGKTASASVTNQDNDITVSFDAYGGSPTPANQVITTGGKVTKPADPTKSDYTFDGWYTDNNTFINKWDFNSHTVGATNFTLYAKWKANNPVPTLTGISPSSGFPGQTLNVTLTGTNFIEGVSTVNGDSGITVNSATVNSSTQITANLTIAAGAAVGTHYLSVTNAGPGGGTSEDHAFEVLAAATLTINQASLDGYSSVCASPSATVKVDVRTTLTGLNWSSTQYQIEGQDAVNVDTTNFTADGLPHTTSFNITVPATPGTYDLTLIACEGEGCTGNHSSSFTITDAIKVGIFGDSFGTVETLYVNRGWTENEVAGNLCSIGTVPGTVTAGSSNGYLKLNNANIVKPGISTVGLTNIHLHYSWGQETYWPYFGSFQVQWKLSSASSWNTVATYTFPDSRTTHPSTNAVDLEFPNAGGSSIDIRFRADGFDWNDYVRVDNVLVTGVPVTYYTVDFDVQGGSPNPPNQQVAEGGYASVPDPAPTKDGYTLEGWYTDNTEYLTQWDFTSDTVTANLTLYAKWTIKQYTVDFDSQGGSAVASQTIDHSGTVSKPADPVRSGYTFAGWYKDAACTDDWVFGTDTVTSDMILYARWAVLDQLLDSTGTSYLMYDQIVAQTFTAGMTGDLYKVSCHLRNTEAINLTAQIQGVNDDGRPNGVVLASSTVNVPAVPYLWPSRWVDNAFTEPLSIQSGERYAIVWSGLGWAVANMEVSNTDSYPEGKAQRFVFGEWLDWAVPDIVFRTFVLSVPGITAVPTTDLATSESGETDTFTIVLDTQPTADVTIGLSSSDPTEGTVSPSSLTFTASNWNSPQTVMITGVDDTIDDGDISYTIYAEATSADANYNGKTASISVANQDDDITVRFNANGGSPTPADQVITTGSKVAMPSDPTRSDYTFDGWFTDDIAFTNQWNFDVNTVGTVNFTLYARWKEAGPTISSVDAISDISVNHGTILEDVELPATAGVTLSDGSSITISVTWDEGTPTYSGDTAGTYVFTGTLTETEGVRNPDGLTASVNVIVAEAVNTPTGEDISVQPLDETSSTAPVTVTFSAVTEPGLTTLSISSEGPANPEGFSFGDPPVFYDIETSAEFTGKVLVCLTYTGLTDTHRLLHYENGVWVDVTVSVDLDNGAICGEVDSFSPFVVAEIIKLDQTITFNDLVNKIYGDVPFEVNADATSGLPVSFAVKSGPASISGNTVTITGAGIVVITASQDGDTYYHPAPDVDRSFIVAKADLTVTADDKGKVYGADDPVLTFTPSGTLFYGDTYGVISGVALSTATGADATAGTHVITASGGVADNYTINHVNGTLTVTAATVNILYTGDQIVKLGETFVAKAQLSGPNAMSISNIKVCFFIEDNIEERKLGEKTTDSSGLVTLDAINTSGWDSGVYTIIARTCDANVAIVEDEATFTVADPGDAATGGGWYTLSGVGRVNFGFTVRKVPNTDPVQYKGQVLIINNEKWRLKGELNDYVAVNNQGAASGTGKLYRWDASLNSGLGDWVLVNNNVSFTISFADNNAVIVKKTKTITPDTFGIHIDYMVDVNDPILPNSSPTDLKGGNIDMKSTDDTGGDTGKTPPGKKK